MKSIHILAAELAKLVPTLQADSLVNNEQLILGKLQEHGGKLADLVDAAIEFHHTRQDVAWNCKAMTDSANKLSDACREYLK